MFESPRGPKSKTTPNQNHLWVVFEAQGGEKPV